MARVGLRGAPELGFPPMCWSMLAMVKACSTCVSMSGRPWIFGCCLLQFMQLRAEQDGRIALYEWVDQYH